MRAAPLLVAAGVVAATLLRPEAATAETASVTVTVPSTVDPPLTGWDVTLNDPPVHPVPVTASVRLPRGARDATLTADGPGKLVQTGAASWRWTPPVRAQPPPYGLTVTVTATYRVGGRTETADGQGTARVVPPPAPTGSGWASDLTLDYATNGYGPIEVDQSDGGLDRGDGKPLTLAGIAYAKGFGTNARSDVGLYLGGACTVLTTDVGVDDVSGNGGTVAFSVVGDGRTLASTPVLRGSSPTAHLTVDVTGVSQLDLRADPTPDGQGQDQADWAGTRLTC